MSGSSFRAPSPTPTPSYVPSTFPQPSATYVAPTAPFATPGYASQWGSGSPYSRSPRTMPDSPQLDADGFPRTLDDLRSYAMASEPVAHAAQDAQPATTTRKRKATKAVAEGAPDAKKTPKGGRGSGVRNFSMAELQELIELIESHRPIGSDGWEAVMAGMQTYWASEGMDARTPESLRRKFAELARKPKPTGDGEMPDLIRRAKDVDREIQNDVHMGNLQDDEDVEEVIPWSPSDREDAPGPAQPARGSHTPSTSANDDVLLRQRRHVTHGTKSSGRPSQTATLLANVSRAFDPDAQTERMQRRESIRAERSLFQSEISSLQAQLRDKQYELVTVSMEKDKLIESLRTQVLQDARALLVVQGELDVAKAKLEMQERMRTMMMGMGNMGQLIAHSMSLSPQEGAHSSSTTM
ncbi:hypothetical protein CALCODRAFT_483332 [Calocera cornea HHB12733]|uniref:DUF6818 domain-containing protein n=1 Tax=Calocera cornea HHB12733 TaxID=1353952 RepID=A0A165FVN7_9BASI|nr:hypothetical protein CALCODRAFT_483332 [Calocera cornea HHB12733]